MKNLVKGLAVCALLGTGVAFWIYDGLMWAQATVATTSNPCPSPTPPQTCTSGQIYVRGMDNKHCPIGNCINGFPTNGHPCLKTGYNRSTGKMDCVKW